MKLCILQDILSDSTHVKIDAEGKVLLSENFINVADLEQTILFAGRGETFQIWNPINISQKRENVQSVLNWLDHKR